MKKLVCLILALTMVLALCACGTKTDEASGAAVPAEDANVESADTAADEPAEASGGIVPGTVINFAAPVDLDSFFPWGSMRSQHFVQQVYDTLLMPYRGDWSDIRGMLATSWESSEDQLTWVFQIRDDVSFTNGNKLTAQSMVDCWAYTIQYQPSYFTNIDSIEATGEYELTFHLSSPCPTLLQSFASSFTGICDPAAIEEFGVDNYDAAIGSGAYYIDDYTLGTSYTLKANPNYWNVDEAPTVETVNYNLIADMTTILSAMAAGEINVMDTTSATTFLNAETYDNLVSDGHSTSTNSIWMNPASELLQNELVREALICFIDQEELAAAATNGTGYVNNCLWRDNAPCYVNYSGYSYDVDKGLGLLEEAGVDPADITLELIDRADTTPMSTNIQAQLKEVGITVNITTYDTATQESLVADGKYDLATVKTSIDCANPMASLKKFIGEDASVNLANFVSDADFQDEINEIWQRAQEAATAEEQNAALTELTTRLMDKCIAIPGPQVMLWTVHSENVKNIVAEDSFYLAYWRFCTIEE